MPTQAKISDVQVITENSRAENKFRVRTANLFVWSYLLFICGAMILGGYKASKGSIADVKDLVITFSGIFSGPLGIIIGYFFRTERERKVKASENKTTSSRRNVSK